MQLMAHFIVGIRKSSDKEPSPSKQAVLVEWDEETGTVKICMPEGEIFFEGLEITHWLTGVDKIHWSGTHLEITEYIHEHFKKEYEGVNLLKEYRLADEYKRVKKEKIKRHEQYMTNWLNKKRKPVY
jgi:hypothetical protein